MKLSSVPTISTLPFHFSKDYNFPTVIPTESEQSCAPYLGLVPNFGAKHKAMHIVYRFSPPELWPHESVAGQIISHQYKNLIFTEQAKADYRSIKEDMKGMLERKEV